MTDTERILRTVNVTIPIWQQVSDIRIKKDFASLNDTIEHLLKNYNGQEVQR